VVTQLGARPGVLYFSQDIEQDLATGRLQREMSHRESRSLDRSSRIRQARMVETCAIDRRQTHVTRCFLKGPGGATAGITGGVRRSTRPGRPDAGEENHTAGQDEATTGHLPKAAHRASAEAEGRPTLMDKPVLQTPPKGRTTLARAAGRRRSTVQLSWRRPAAIGEHCGLAPEERHRQKSIKCL